jgi:hypothetical protein
VVTNLTGTASININGTVGATTPAAGTFTSLSDSGNLTFTSTGNRITGDFSNATGSSRVNFQTSTTNGTTTVDFIPNGTGTLAQVALWNNSSTTNAAFASYGCSSTALTITAGISGTGTYLPITMFTGGSESLRIDTSGNVGIGTSSPTAKVQIFSNGAPAASGNMTTGMAIASAAGSFAINIGADATAGYTWLNSAYINSSNTASPMVFMTGATERMRIDSSGNLLVGTTSPTLNNTNSFVVAPDPVGGFTVTNHKSGSASGSVYAYYGYNGGSIGGITQNGTTGVSYVTSSDYRLKENIAPMQNALNVVFKLKPVTYKWKTDGTDGQGFIAHELQAVVPECVTGEKDGMRTEIYEISPLIPAEIDEDGKVIKEAVKAIMGKREVPAYQGIDTSFLVATLTAAIQEQQVMIETLTTRLNALEGK